MAENKVVIRINYDKDKQRKNLIDPKMVTVWHTRRILAALAILALLLIPLLFWLFSDEDEISTIEQPVNSVDTSNRAGTQPAITSSDIVGSQTINKADINQTTPVKRPVAIIFDKRVIRASLNTELKDKQPLTPAVLPLRIAGNQTQELFYFSEIKNIKDKVLFHHWLKNGQVVHKKQLEIKDSKSRLISSRIMSAKDKGEWQVLLIDKKGKLFSEANFLVNPD